jgi:hypothetical protein
MRTPLMVIILLALLLTVTFVTRGDSINYPFTRDTAIATLLGSGLLGLWVCRRCRKIDASEHIKIWREEGPESHGS